MSDPHRQITPLITSPPATPTRSTPRTATARDDAGQGAYRYGGTSRDDHVVHFDPAADVPSPRATSASTPRTPTMRRGFFDSPSATRATVSPTSVTSSSPRSPRRATRPSSRAAAHSTSIDFSASCALAFDDLVRSPGGVDPDPPSIELASNERDEVEQPLLDEHSSAPPRRSSTAATTTMAKKHRRSRRLEAMRWTVIWSTASVTLIVWLTYKVVLRRQGQGRGRELKDEMMSLISTRFDSAHVFANHTYKQENLGDGQPRLYGRDGDTVRMENGQEFVYRNPFGGTFLQSSTGHSWLGAKAQSDVPSLAEEWDYETMTISGVNLGGWLTLEPFITPAQFEPYLNSTTPGPAVDEYTLSQNLLHRGGERHLFEVLDHHYKTFITEKDFAEIAGAGLNWVRIPVPFWSVSKWPGEPFLERTSWKYFLKALEWSRKYGLRVNLDLHSVPGSQNGWNHSGKWGSINWLHSTMGYANAQRSLDYIETLAQFVSRPEVAEVVKMFSLLNEPMMNVIGPEPLRSFYSKAYRLIRAQTGYNSGPMIAIHDGFKGTRRWYDFATAPQFRDFPPADLGDDGDNKEALRRGGWDRVAIDSHRYLAFSEPDTNSVRDQILKPCQKWAPEFNKTFNGFGVPIAGEFSIAPNDCGRFLNNVNQGTRLEGTFLNEATGNPVFNASAPHGSCEFWEDYENWSTELKDDMRDLAYAQMDTFQNWFYWTWKTAPSLEHPDRFANPLWSYSLGLARGWIPRDPRRSANFCYAYAEHTPQRTTGMPRRRPRKSKADMEGWKIGRYLDERERSIPPERDDASRDKYPWPPKYFNLDPMSAPASFDAASPKLTVDTLPRYARSSNAALELPGLDSSQDTSPRRTLAYAPIAGCTYPDTWHPENSTVWSKVCLAAP